ncbi:MAG TPA: DNA N-6-adenine-methyltransferase [Polyangiaceae bacterium]|jgi:hypothetical protein
MSPKPKKRAHLAQHLSLTDQHFTPPPFIEAARQVLGGIDLDVASCEAANRIVRAERFFTREDNALRRDLEWRGRVWCNPPGTKDGRESRAKAFWQKLVAEWHAGRTTSAIFLGFSLEILQTTQSEAVGAIPLDFPFCIPRERIPFLKGSGKKQEPLFGTAADEVHGYEVQTQPTHANVFVLLPPMGLEGAAVEKSFVRVFSRFGKVRT